MTITLTAIEARVLGCLVEKELATPDYYPLTLNALVNACNQKSNRDPVMSLSDDDVLQAIDNLRFEQLAHTSAEGVRATKYCHNLEGLLTLEREDLAILAVLLLRGPQTQGELRTRTERMFAFPDLEAIETVLQGLIDRDTPLVERLSRQPGRKEHRYAQLLSETTEEDHPGEEPDISEPVVSRQDRFAQLEQEVSALRQELAELRSSFQQFKAQFD